MLRLLSFALAAASSATHAVELQSVVHSSKQCIEGKTHSLEYKASMVTSEKFVDLDGDLGSKLSSVTCDIDHTNLQLKFKHDTDAVAYLAKFHDWDDYFIVGGSAWNCSVVAPSASRPTYILRRIVGASETLSHLRTMSVRTSMARYDEVFESADISYGVTEGCDLGTSKHICLGYNTQNCDGTAAKPLPLFSTTMKDGAKLAATCTDCWASLSADVFVDISIKGFKLESLSGGFRNVMLNASTVVQANAQGNWNTVLDKTLPLLATTYLLNFKVESVPFMLYFDVPMEVKGSLAIQGLASVTMGAHASVVLGDVSVRWSPTTHWTHTVMKPAFAFTPTLQTQDQVDVTGALSLIPSFNMHFDRIFSYNLKATGNLNVDVALQGKQICEKSTYDLNLVSNTELDININVLDFHKDWTWGPTTVGQWSGQPIKDFCVSV